MKSSPARYGLKLFAIYVVLYAGFMALNAFFPEASGWVPFAGVNLAILYGMVLIVTAALLACLYVFLCGRAESAEGPERQDPEAAGR